MLDRLPDFIDPILFAERRRELSGSIKLSEFSRLSDLLIDGGGDVRFEFSFFKEGRLAVVRGTINAVLHLRCQSCLQAMSWPLEATVNLAVVTSLEQADRLAAEYEPLLLKGEKISLLELVEDEILLLLPDFPRHEKKCVEAGVGLGNSSAGHDEHDIRSDNPFSVLAKLKNTGDL